MLTHCCVTIITTIYNSVGNQIDGRYHVICFNLTVNRTSDTDLENRCSAQVKLRIWNKIH